MRILNVSPWIPYPCTSGMTIRITEIARRLAREHRVTFALPVRWPADLGHCEALREMGFGVIAMPGNRGVGVYLESLAGFLRGRPPDNAFFGSHALEDYLALNIDQFDVIQLEYEICGRLPYQIPRYRRAVCAIVMHDLLSESYLRMARIEQSMRSQMWRLLNVPGFRRFERRVLRSYDLSIVMSDRERDIVSRYTDPSKIAVIPNCADSTLPALEQASNPHPVILFVGQLEYPPNIDAAQWLIRDIFPRIRAAYPMAQLILVGRPNYTNLRLNGEGVLDAGVVPDLVPYYRQADVVVAPLRAGSGTRLKILEAMARGRVVVSTSLAAEGLEVIDSRHLILADSAEAIAERVISIFRDPDRRALICNQARELVERRYNWDDAARALSDRYAQLLLQKLNSTNGTTHRSQLTLR
jgi:glycosyltransferase involved in cell wall biosynthesis